MADPHAPEPTHDDPPSPTPPAEPPHEDLEHKVNASTMTFGDKLYDFVGVGKDFLYVAATTAITASVTGVGGLAQGAALGLANLISNRNEKDGNEYYTGVRNEINKGNIMAVALDKIFALQSKIPIDTWLGYFGRLAAGFYLVVPTFNTMYLTLSEVMKKYSPFSFVKDTLLLRTPGELYKTVRDDVAPKLDQTNRDAAFYLWPGMTYLWNHVKDQSMKIPVSGVLTFLYGLIPKGTSPGLKSLPPTHPSNQPQPSPSPAATPAHG